MLSEKKQIDDVTVVRMKQEALTGHEAPDVKTGLLELLVGEGEKFLVNMKNVALKQPHLQIQGQH